MLRHQFKIYYQASFVQNSLQSFGKWKPFFDQVFFSTLLLWEVTDYKLRRFTLRKQRGLVLKLASLT